MADPDEKKTMKENTVQDHLDTESSLSPELQASIGRKLKQVYADLVNEPIPDKFSKLLDELAKSKKEPEKPD